MYISSGFFGRWLKVTLYSNVLDYNGNNLDLKKRPSEEICLTPPPCPPPPSKIGRNKARDQFLFMGKKWSAENVRAHHKVM